MTFVEILNVRPSTKPDAIFVSAGDRQTFATYALSKLIDTFDVLIFQYGSSQLNEDLKKNASLLARGTGTKFNALKEIFRQRRELLLNYRTIWVCDDDLILENGDYRTLPAVVGALDVQVVSPAYSIRGKISHQIMLPVLGRHFFRYTSFIEMGCPLFCSKALAKFLDNYDGSLLGYADDWWFLNVLEADKKAVVGIVDTVTIINPTDKQKPGGYGEAELLGKREALRLAWLAAKEKYGYQNWSSKNLSYVTQRQLPRHRLTPRPELFRRRFRDDFRTALSALNYAMRFYKLRKHIAKALKSAMVSRARVA